MGERLVASHIIPFENSIGTAKIGICYVKTLIIRYLLSRKIINKNKKVTAITRNKNTLVMDNIYCIENQS